ncbi:F-box/LRR-repeat/kelch-repeat protein [Cardamine amara subsp. amara]|uniref:F-box/LRR-repeat/kelch-repeat protein n=1 Tax=Cardamine amara subsp. amara TaxID=228776 RepID=A0ABD1ACE1_CARAN
MIVNPCTDQTRWIQPRSVYHMHDSYALGYASSNNKSYESYKILSFPYDHCKKAEIFELKSNSWRVLANIPPNEDLGTYGRGNIYQYTYGRGVLLKGNTYWISYFSDYSDILSFDFITERFRRRRLPFQILSYNTLAL